ncbi:acyl carrier protein [Variovorax boronicumulans]|uniref:acyl carrier protein n=1 Tax=Variovorax boronicumulans TaxID=436515 RepID=UPI0027871A94|nr:acyl carrier protein [Variovorax boronicumulans]MDP9912354.1 acyl carrier protein [Variovorax boronicumulans]
MKSPTDIEEIKIQVRQVVAKYGRLSQDIASLSDESSLSEAGMTSHASVNVMLALEAQFGEFPEHLLTRSSFRSVASIVQAVCTLPDH